MRLGVNVPHYGRGTSPDAVLKWVEFSEGAGFSIATLSDHVALTQDVAAIYPEPFYDPFTTLAWLAGQTETIELGTSVAIVPYRSPLLMARMGACIDRFSAGRFVFGVGAGWSEKEFAALDVDFAHRGAITDEYLFAVLELWTADLMSVHGEFVSFENVQTGPHPSRFPHPPVWVGGSSRAAIVRAARFANAWHPIAPPLAWLRTEGMPALRDAADQVHRPEPALCPRINLNIDTTDRSDQDRPLGVGSMSQVLDDLEALEDLGAECVVLDSYVGAEDHRETRAHWRMLEELASRRL